MAVSSDATAPLFIELSRPATGFTARLEFNVPQARLQLRQEVLEKKWRRCPFQNGQRMELRSTVGARH